jgi:uncharacterized protein YajQ (UPF0234 family)
MTGTLKHISSLFGEACLAKSNLPQHAAKQIKTDQIRINSREIDAILQNIIDLLRILLYN